MKEKSEFEILDELPNDAFIESKELQSLQYINVFE